MVKFFGSSDNIGERWGVIKTGSPHERERKRGKGTKVQILYLFY